MNYQSLERTIGHQFADITLLDLAMTHPSYALQHKCQDNQRLEFLGDAVLEICVSRVIYHKYPKLREGQLTRKRAALGEETPTYEIIGQDGPPHARVFTARVLRADGSELGTGTGARKQRAEEAAAQMAMCTLQGENR